MMYLFNLLGVAFSGRWFVPTETGVSCFLVPGFSWPYMEARAYNTNNNVCSCELEASRGGLKPQRQTGDADRREDVEYLRYQLPLINFT